MKKFALFAALTLAVTLLFSACSKDDDGGPKGSHKVVYKITGSDKAQIYNVVYFNESGDATSVTGVDDKTWTSSELTIPASVSAIGITASGATTDDKDGSLTVQIIVDGKVQKENTATGPILAASVQYSF